MSTSAAWFIGVLVGAFAVTIVAAFQGVPHVVTSTIAPIVVAPAPICDCHCDCAWPPEREVCP